MEPRFAILAVCTANICRSPFIEAVLRDRLDREHFEVASAGVRGWTDHPMDAMSAMELMRFGLEPGTFRSHPLDDYFIDSASLVLTATTAHRASILGSSPHALRRVFTLLEFAQLVSVVECDGGPAELVAEAARFRNRAKQELDIADPYRRKPAVYRAAAEQMHAACVTVADHLNVAARSAAVRS
ncbi:MAG: hypothetical protein QM597_02135 [Aeromicrobium sp.]|uniref:arsenate reductase/protein-tyrosine-phosphatase family protein n=1 Tax=Aeromicrobium sp. TaxID=1871063 RepID=UPI0039E6BABB